MKVNLLKKLLKKSCAVLVIAALLIATAQCAFADTADVTDAATDVGSSDSVSSSTATGYFGQYDEVKASADTETVYELDAASAKTQSGAKAQNVKDRVAVSLNEDNTWCEWQLDIKEAASYNIRIEYLPDVSFDNDITLNVMVDGVVPFTEAANLSLSRKWRSAFLEGDYPFEKDNRGNDIRPEQVQVEDWLSASFEDTQGLYDEPYYFYFDAGKHTLRINYAEAPVAIGKVVLEVATSISYKEYLAKYEGTQVKGGEGKFIEAELAESVSNASIYPNYDNLSASMSPCDPKNTVLNLIGGSNWGSQGETISWKADVEKAGLYKIVLRGRQNVNAGLNSYRTLLVNGELPFAEAEILSFNYSTGWQIFTLGNGEKEYLIYLEPGDIVSLSSTSGNTAVVLRNVQQINNDLNELYRQILAITSATPDTYQDYDLEDKIPDLEKNLRDANKRIMTTYEELCAALGTTGSQASTLKMCAETILDYADAPYEIPESLSTFKGVLEKLGSLILALCEQPLELDYIGFLPVDCEEPNVSASFWDGLVFMTKQFLYSFTSDYSSMGSTAGESGKTITVWINTGRDQAQIISNLIASEFTEETGIGVTLNMVDTNTTLLRAALAGKGPDVALMMSQGQPVELAARGALVDLTEYISEDVYDDFHSSSWVPFYYGDKIYALPESQSFMVLFYRTDIFEQLELKAPDTWDEFYRMLEVIQSNNLNVGMAEINAATMGVSSSLSIFSSLLFQKGTKSYYTDDLSETLFTTENAYQAFTEWARFYTDYGISRSIDFYSRFRTGEVPVGFSNFATYSQLIAAAPEIRGMWAMAPMVGMRNEETGEIDRSETSAVTGCVMLKAAEQKGVADEAYEFLKWWVSAETQMEYCNDVEVTLGIAGRYYSANLEAFDSLNWSKAEKAVLDEQRKHLNNIPTVIGSYAVDRDLTTALREVIDGANRPRRALLLYNSDINEEIQRKRKEFGLDGK
ncbi:MAG: extracellular solute-binding protein [Clostridia bacterium]|nr:extracellular solute-binding protein [Clostridia bacterium]